MKHSRTTGPVQPAWSVFPELAPAEPSAAGLRRLRQEQPVLSLVSRDGQATDKGHIRSSVLSFSNLHRHGDLFAAYMRARKDVFIDRLHWTLPVADGMEFDQYDTPLARWVVIHEFGEVLAGVRFMPTTAQVGLHSYMLRDAQLGLLPHIPTDVLFFKAPVHDRIWEATRLFITDAVPGHRRQAVQAELMRGFAATARAGGAGHVIGIVPAVWSRWLRRLNLGAVPVGPQFSIDGTRSQAALFNVSGLAARGVMRFNSRHAPCFVSRTFSVRDRPFGGAARAGDGACQADSD